MYKKGADSRKYDRRRAYFKLHTRYVQTSGVAIAKEDHLVNGLLPEEVPTVMRAIVRSHALAHVLSIDDIVVLDIFV